ncbi:NHLP leader peptide family RiPP precursor [Tumebacillus permanentifrigoris]|uniref:Putative ribosomally synthesized peptide n=1 Tax=Tumebacillus permanentifrigoris TaxID=378543 RepID=A0A316D2F8_9BACL|nr:NHLP leader peptide family RiPP precursor [Tumebacillus permanentifrigoris]PWK04966.1 putative ribosomally synthesized peptide [Tumebacillus permanentifrigoris]
MHSHKNYDEVVAKAWSDPSFKERLKQDPHSVLAEHGIEVPKGTQVTVVEDTDAVQHLILPLNLTGGLAPSVSKLCDG